MPVSKNSRQRKKAIVLLSGGIDSATALYLARRKGYRCTALIFDYGQRHKKEIESARKIAKRARCSYTEIKLSFPWKGSSLVDHRMKLPRNRSLKAIKKSVPSTYVPARNIIFMSIATSLAEKIHADAIFIGVHTEDFSGYPDCRIPFFRAFKKTINTGTKSGRAISINTPLIDKSKKEIIRMGLRLGVPFELTWSCYKGSKFPCGRCDSCLFRKKGFEELGMKDPYYDNKSKTES